MSSPSRMMRPGGGRIEPSQKSQQRALAAARRAHDGDELAALNFQIDAAQNIHAMSGGGDAFGESGNLDGGRSNRDLPAILYYGIGWLACRSISFFWLDVLWRAFALALRRPPHMRDTRPVIVAFGDSLSAGYGAEPGKSFPDFLQKDLDAAGLHWHVVNAGVSGNTTTDGLDRINEVLAL